MKRNEIYHISLASCFSALGAVFVIVGGFFEIADLLCATLAALFVFAAAEELPGKYPLLVYAVISVMAAIFMPLRYSTIYFALFLGYYPIAKPHIDALRLRSKFLYRAAKLSLYTVNSAVLLFLPRLLIESDEIYTPWTVSVSMILQVIFMVCFDHALNNIRIVYRYYLRKIFKKRK